MTLQGTKALEKWCRIVTEGYSGVNIVNMSTSWRSGLGFCAIIHHFRPELIDFSLLDPDDALGNNRTAFEVAEQHLGIPALLDPQDMVECELLDRLSILTYISQFYQAFHGSTVIGKPKREPLSPPGKSLPLNKTLLPIVAGRRNEPCKMCGKPVFILERLNVSGRLLHRTCFKCARCDTQLNVLNYYETESGRYCCDMCPDEEKSMAEVVQANKKIMEEHLESSDSEEETKDVNDNATTEQPAVIKPADNNNADLNDNDLPKAIDSDNPIPIPNRDDTMHNSQADMETSIDVSEKSIRVGAEVVGVLELVSAPQEFVSNNVQEVQIPTSHREESNNFRELETAESHSHQDLPDVLHLHKTGVSLETSSISSKEENSLTCTESIDQHQYPDVMNPFDEENVEQYCSDLKKEVNNRKNTEMKKESTNPFASDLEDSSDEDNHLSAKPVVTAQGTPLTGPPKPPRVSLNPFGSDFDDDDDDAPGHASPSPSTGAVKARKKRPAPKPPGKSPTPTPSPRSVNRQSHQPTPTPRRSITPHLQATPPSPALSVSSVNSHKHPPPPRPPPPSDSPYELPKDRKERDNQNRRSQQMLEASGSETSSLMSVSQSSSSRAPILLTPLSPDKAFEGQWKKKKGPAPPRPIPQKRQVKKLPRKAVNTELHDIEIKQQELERQGVKLEKTIRELCEKNDKERSEQGLENNDRDSLGPEAEDLIIQLFDLVNEKNDLFRRQTELMYMKRDHRLEEEHADIEHQIRLLMAKPELQRSDEDRTKEEQLISRLMQVVAQRNEIVDCLEMDRLRELDEDESIEIHMGEYAAIKPPDDASQKKKKKKKKEKEDKKKKKKDKDFDADKDIDTSELPNSSPRGSPKKIPSEKDKAKKLKKKILASLTLTPSTKKA